jgi:hypothetical protein
LATYLLERPLSEVNAVSFDFQKAAGVFHHYASTVTLLTSQHLKTLCLNNVYVGAERNGSVERLLAAVLQASQNLEYMRVSLYNDTHVGLLLDTYLNVASRSLRVLHVKCCIFEIKDFESRFPVLEELNPVAQLDEGPLISKSLLSLSWQQEAEYNEYKTGAAEPKLVVRAPD